MKFSTKAIHPEIRVYDDPGVYDPKSEVLVLESILASLDEAEHAVIFPSSSSALMAIAGILSPGDKVVELVTPYGLGISNLASVFQQFDIKHETLVFNGCESLEKALSKNVSLLLLQSPTDFYFEVFDIEACTKIAKRHGVLTIVDNSLATPYFQNPLKWGAELVCYTRANYFTGKPESTAGIITTNSSDMHKELLSRRTRLESFDRLDGSIKTMAIRMQKHEENALKIAKFLNNHPKVENVYYPGLPEHTSYAIAKKQMLGFGGLLSADFSLSLESTSKLVDALSLFSLSPNFGAVESLVDHPAGRNNPRNLSNDGSTNNLREGLVRFSVGIEDVQDLINDLDQALELID
ncbi:MAG: PLP-dependent transferase [Parachlamydiaceae bacterium]|nr:PLP-dependent transferase [Parachlamydiaceae bacterium]